MGKQSTGANTSVAKGPLERDNLARIRTHLANRRTFLAWCRTSLGVMGLGFLLDRMEIWLTMGQQHGEAPRDLGVLGLITFSVGLLLALTSGWHYYRMRKEIGPMDKGDLFWPELVLLTVICLVAVYFLIFWKN